MTKRLEGKVAIVTGAARGIGRAYCLAMAREGAHIVGADLLDTAPTKKAVEEHGVKALALNVDVSSEEDTLRMAQETIAAFGRIDILVSNAAISPEQPLDEISFADWRKVLAVDLDGVFLCAKAVIPQMKKQKSGRIINIASSTVFMSFPNLTHYIAAKAGVIGMTRALATELGDYGILVNAISPGLTQTERTVSVPDEVWGMQVAMQSVKRREEPEDLVGAAVFLASDDAAFITGQTLSVCGGFVKR
ncbi:MAG TPA: 3-oxoacyl-ACP reductase family protein [Pyrinomonadaceae bacterium]|nr:3-oxoacyl-ACP reductase family protein [Pyrinomonadaceae bacterium]